MHMLCSYCKTPLEGDEPPFTATVIESKPGGGVAWGFYCSRPCTLAEMETFLKADNPWKDTVEVVMVDTPAEEKPTEEDPDEEVKHVEIKPPPATVTGTAEPESAPGFIVLDIMDETNTVTDETAPLDSTPPTYLASQVTAVNVLNMICGGNEDGPWAWAPLEGSPVVNDMRHTAVLQHLSFGEDVDVFCDETTIAFVFELSDGYNLSLSMPTFSFATDVSSVVSYFNNVALEIIAKTEQDNEPIESQPLSF